MVIDASLIIGIIGMLLILIAFFMVQRHRWSQDDVIYDLLNLIGSVLLVYYGIIGKAWPFVVLNAVWALYSLKDVYTDTRKSDSKPLKRF